jgi:hypothetical protein
LPVVVVVLAPCQRTETAETVFLRQLQEAQSLAVGVAVA